MTVIGRFPRIWVEESKLSHVLNWNYISLDALLATITAQILLFDVDDDDDDEWDVGYKSIFYISKSRVVWAFSWLVTGPFIFPWNVKWLIIFSRISRGPCFSKINFRETRNKSLIRRDPWLDSCLCYCLHSMTTPIMYLMGVLEFGFHFVARRKWSGRIGWTSNKALLWK